MGKKERGECFMKVYHGSIQEVRFPLAKIGRSNLDFGQGFYDRVIDTIEAYMVGNISLEKALGELSKHRPNNQLCLLSQALIDECLHFIDVKPIKD